MTITLLYFILKLLAQVAFVPYLFRLKFVVGNTGVRYFWGSDALRLFGKTIKNPTRDIVGVFFNPRIRTDIMERTLNSKIFLNPIINLEETGKNIKEHIKASNLKVSDLQNLFGFEQPQSIYNWQKGTDLPKIDNFVRLAHFLNTTIDQLIVVKMYENQAEEDVPQEFRI